MYSAGAGRRVLLWWTSMQASRNKRIVNPGGGEERTRWREAVVGWAYVTNAADSPCTAGWCRSQSRTNSELPEAVILQQV